MATSDLISLVNQATALAEQAYSDAQSAATDAINAASGVFTISSTNLLPPDSISYVDPTNFPAQQDETFVIRSGEPSIGTLEEVYLPKIQTIDELDLSTLLDLSDAFQHDQPSRLGEFTGVAPPVVTTLNELQGLQEPNDIAAIPPTFHTPADIASPSLVLPRFDPGSDPALSQAAPTDLDTQARNNWNEALSLFKNEIERWSADFLDAYAPGHATQYNELQTKITDGLTGGDAMPDSIEQRIHDRRRARITAEGNAQIAEIQERARASGYPVPQIVPIALARQAAQAAANQNAASATEVAIENQKLKQQWLQFCMEVSQRMTATALQVAIDYARVLTSINSQAIEYSKMNVGYVVEVFNLAVRVYNADIELYRAKAAVFEAELTAALADVERVKAEVAIEQAKTQIDELKLRKYEAEIGVFEQQVRYYSEQLRQIGYIIDSRRLPIENFKLQVEGYAASAEGKRAEVDVFRALMDGDAKLVDANLALINEYRAKVDAAASGAQVEIEKGRAYAAYNETVVEKYRQQLTEWLAKVGVDEKEFNSRLQVKQINLERFANDVRNSAEKSRHNLQNEEQIWRRALEFYKGTLDSKFHQGDWWAARSRLLAQTSADISRTYSSAAAAGLSAQNGLIGVIDETTRSE